jgi:glucose-1-phosphate cytidylyltransferase
MKTVLLAGGLGSRLSEETTIRPKPMVEIGGIPILVHIMRLYAHAGFRDFIVALGYRGDMIREYFAHYHLRHGDVTIHLPTGTIQYGEDVVDDWNVRLVDTGGETLTGGRLHRLERIVGDETFMLTYGDGVADLDIRTLVEFHRAHGKLATVTAVRPPARFGAITFDGNRVVDFREKPQTEAGWINGGFFVFEPGIFRYLSGDETILEREPLERLANDGELMAYKHEGFWHAMDTVRDRDVLNALWKSGAATWKRDSSR